MMLLTTYITHKKFKKIWDKNTSLIAQIQKSNDFSILDSAILKNNTMVIG